VVEIIQVVRTHVAKVPAQHGRSATHDVVGGFAQPQWVLHVKPTRQTGFVTSYSSLVVTTEHSYLGGYLYLLVSSTSCQNIHDDSMTSFILSTFDNNHPLHIINCQALW
jgi:hypothetical protein